MHAAAIRACAGEGGLPAIRSLGLFESCNFIGAVALPRWPGVGHEAVANKGHGEEVPWAAGLWQEAGMVMECSMG